MKLSKIAKLGLKALEKHSVELSIGGGIASYLASTYFTIKATEKSVRMIEEHKPETKMDYVKLCWKNYIPTAIALAGGTLGVMSGYKIQKNRGVALAAAYSLTEAAYDEYRTAVKEEIGEKKEAAVRERAAANAVQNEPPKTSEVIVTSKGKTLCYDVYSRRYFESDIESIRKAVNGVNYQLNGVDNVSLNEFYSALKLKGLPFGDEWGWNRHYEGLIEIDYHAIMSEDDQPCIAIEFMVDPVKGFADIWRGPDGN